MNDINEIKKMLDKLNEELESLRAENSELKLRLAKYKTVEENSCNTEDLQELMNSLPFGGQDVSRFFKGLFQIGCKTMGDCKKLSIADILNLPGVGLSAAETGIAILEVYGGIHFDVNNIPMGKVKKSYSNINYNVLRRRVPNRIQQLKEAKSGNL